MSLYMCVHTCVHMCVCLCACVCAHVFVHAHVCAHVCACVYVCAHVCACAQAVSHSPTWNAKTHQDTCHNKENGASLQDESSKSRVKPKWLTRANHEAAADADNCSL